MAVIFLGGVSGVGKSSVAQNFTEKLPVLALNGSSELMRYLGLPPGDYDQLRKLPNEIKEKSLADLFIDLANKIETVVITGHYVKVLGGHITPSYGRWYQYCRTLVHISSSPQSIFRRIVYDEMNYRRTGRNLFGVEHVSIQERVQFIETAQLSSIKIMERAAQEFTIPSFCVENRDGKLFDTVEKIVRII